MESQEGEIEGGGEEEAEDNNRVPVKITFHIYLAAQSLMGP